MKRIIVDSNYIAYRAMFSMRGLSHREMQTGVLFGFFQEILRLAIRWGTNDFVFAWDSRKSYRKLEYPQYKERRSAPSEENRILRELGYPQFDILRTEALSKFGFQNICMQTGLEADDIIGDIVLNNRCNGAHMIVVSPDRDLYQLLHHCILYHPQTKEIFTKEKFTKQYGIEPEAWKEVRCIAGCSTDNVGGCAGVREGYAIKYLTGSLTKGERYDAIKNGEKIIERNRPLVTLPHRRTKPVELKDNAPFTRHEVLQCFEDYGFKSFMMEGQWAKWRDAFNIA